MRATQWATRRDQRRIARTSAAADLDIALERIAAMPNPSRPPVVDQTTPGPLPRIPAAKAANPARTTVSQEGVAALARRGAFDVTPEGWHHVQVTFTFDTNAASDDDLRLLVEHATVQFADPRDDEGDASDVETANVTADWFIVPDAYRRSR